MKKFLPQSYNFCQITRFPLLNWIKSSLERAALDDATTRLMQSPLQVTIMTVLCDRLGQPPKDRWKLFNAYYEVIYQREVERDIPASRLLREYQEDINNYSLVY